MKLQFIILTCFILISCSAPARPTREGLAGKYVYKSEDPAAKPSDHSFDLLTLKADGTYDFVQGGTTKSRTEAVGSWRIWDAGAQGPQLLLGRSSYPIRIKGN